MPLASVSRRKLTVCDGTIIPRLQSARGFVLHRLTARVRWGPVVISQVVQRVFQDARPLGKLWSGRDAAREPATAATYPP
jgi:hypothetical protein